MSKLTLNNVANISGAESTAISTINANSDAIETALENTLSRDGTSPNTMSADLDMNDNDILNVDNINVNHLSVAGLSYSPTNTFYATSTALYSIGLLTPAADKFPYYTGPASAALTSLTAAARTKLAQTSLEAFELVDPNGPRNPIRYYFTNQVQIASGTKVAMGGHRFQGRFKRNKVPVYAEPSPSDGCRHIISWGNGSSTSGDLAFESLSSQETWYAAFWCANNGDTTAVIKVVPFLRVKSVAGNVVTLGSTEENVAATTAKTHNFSTNGLVGSEVLVINETLNSRAKAFSGRLTTVTANTTTTVTLASAGTMAVGDWFLPAPVYDHYAYIGCWLAETGSGASAELRNISDSGTVVMTRGVYNYNSGANPLNGDYSTYGVGTGLDLFFDTLISPLAMGVTFTAHEAYSTSAGDVILRIGPDYAHDTYTHYWYKCATPASQSYIYPVPMQIFSWQPTLNFHNGGSIKAARTAANVLVLGWLEP